MFDILVDLAYAIIRSNRPGISVTNQTQTQAEYEAYKSNVMASMYATEKMEKETDPIRKKRMEYLINHGIYDFSDI